MSSQMVDVQPLRHAADPEPGFIHVFHWRRLRRSRARRRRSSGTARHNSGSYRRWWRHQMHAEQIGHRHRQALLGRN